jgi:alpha-methylacyl-CoA racemase
MGPLSGVKIVEMAGIGPGPFCAMLLGDLGAEIVSIDRPGGGEKAGLPFTPQFDFFSRNKLRVAIDLKSAEGCATALKLIDAADILIEGFRPGVMEKLGLGPEAVHARNPRLVYGRMTGWGQTGPLAHTAGHDINYVALSGILSTIGPKDAPPTIPLNMVGDFGGGSLYLALGVLAAYIEAARSGKGQVVDAAIVDGVASLGTMLFALRGIGNWPGGRGENMLDGGAPFYSVYETKDGGYVAIGPLEGKFYAEFIARLGLDPASVPNRSDRKNWPELRTLLTERFKMKTRDEWTAIMEGSDACFAPILSLEEAPHDPHNAARETFVVRHGATQPAPAPKFSRTPAAIRFSAADPEAIATDRLAAWGLNANDLKTIQPA